jgi:ribonucleoside-diphosphate reductase beta chain
MSGTANIFQMINRDELQHVRNFQKIINEIKVEIPECYSEERIYEITSEAVEKELLWTNHIIGNDILGMPEQTNEEYIKYRANLILKGLGLNPIYNQIINPYKHLEDFSDTEDKASVKPNFFEATSTGYVQSSGVDGWDF